MLIYGICFSLYLLSDWRIVALQYAGLCQTTMQMSRNSICIHPLSFEPPSPPQYHRSRSSQDTRLGSLFCIADSHCCCLATKSCPTLCHPWTAARQAPLSMRFSRQESWSGLHFLLQGIFLTQGLNPSLLGLLHHLPQLEKFQEVLPSRRDEAHFR